MPRALILCLPLVVLVVGVPWYFTESSDWRLFGLPAWVVFSIGAAFVFACVVAVLIGRCWELSAGSDEGDETDR